MCAQPQSMVVWRRLSAKGKMCTVNCGNAIIILLYEFIILWYRCICYRKISPVVRWYGCPQQHLPTCVTGQHQRNTCINSDLYAVPCAVCHKRKSSNWRCGKSFGTSKDNAHLHHTSVANHSHPATKSYKEGHVSRLQFAEVLIQMMCV